jgi:hypothetical protein
MILYLLSLIALIYFSSSIIEKEFKNNNILNDKILNLLIGVFIGIFNNGLFKTLKIFNKLIY